MRVKKIESCNVFVKFAVFVLVTSSVVTAFSNLTKYNDYRQEIEVLEQKKAEHVENIERLQYELGREVDADYIIEIARNNLNLCLPNETIYFTGLN